MMEQLKFDEVLKPKKIWTQQEIADIINTNDTQLGKALVRLYDCQTESEKDAGETKDHNGIGFNAFDAPLLSSFALYFKRYGYLSEKQIVATKKRIFKYLKQLTTLANA